MKNLLTVGAVALSAFAVVGFHEPEMKLQIGGPAPEISSKTWFNHIGRPLTLENLRGSAVLIEFWATW
jgi:hypothetical protein